MDGGWVAGGWLEELELKQVLQFCFGLKLRKMSNCGHELCGKIAGFVDSLFNNFWVVILFILVQG